MTRLVLTGVAGRKLRRVDLSFDAGLHAMVGGPDDEAAELVAICAGMARPRRGVVLVNGRRPFQSPGTRQTIGALLDVEAPLEGPTVEASITRALEPRRGGGTARDALGSFGLQALLRRSPASLSSLELRSVALSLSLALESPGLLVLYEPFAAGLPRRDVEARLSERARCGAVVLSVLASAREAAESGAEPVFIRPSAGVLRGEARPAS